MKQHEIEQLQSQAERGAKLLLEMKSAEKDYEEICRSSFSIDVQTFRFRGRQDEHKVVAVQVKDSKGIQHMISHYSNQDEYKARMIKVANSFQTQISNIYKDILNDKQQAMEDFEVTQPLKKA